MADFWSELTTEVRERIELGEASVKRLARGEHIEWWLNAGRALAAMQAEALRHAASNTPKGPHYNAAWKVLARHAPGLAALDKSARSHAVWLATEWEAVNGWLQKLPPNKRLTLNHPRAVHRSYDATHLPLPPETPKKKAGTRLGFKPGASAEEVGEHIAGQHKPEYLRRLAKVLITLADREERQDGIEAKARKRGAKRKAQDAGPARYDPSNAARERALLGKLRS
jgi:hypothetical protein